ncbi:MAG: PhnD/SsuA/transferrin family substrate-binding protein [Paracoccaceae bacterium]
MIELWRQRPRILQKLLFGGIAASRRRVPLYSWLAALALSLPVPAAADITLVFGTYAADKPTETVRQYKPFLNYLADEMSVVLGEPVKIRMKIAKDYDTGIGHLADGDVDFARFGPASYVTVVERNPGIKIVAMESNAGEKRFKGVIAVHSESDAHSLADLKDKSFAFGSELSTIGRYLAQSHLLDVGIGSENLSGFEYLGRHDVVGTAVGAKKFTAGALQEDTFQKLVKQGVPIKMLFEFDNVTKPWLAASDIDPKVLDAMRQVMLSLHNDEVAASVAKDGFLDGTDSDYDFIRRAMLHSRDF